MITYAKWFYLLNFHTAGSAVACRAASWLAAGRVGKTVVRHFFIRRTNYKPNQLYFVFLVLSVYPTHTAASRFLILLKLQRNLSFPGIFLELFPPSLVSEHPYCSCYVQEHSPTQLQPGPVPPPLLHILPVYASSPSTTLHTHLTVYDLKRQLLRV